ncbi:MAG: hypothetical protein H6672_20065 [Anaerolineaceae bacterium]|nr:hypothetical protein [Anaerolineaceae bacterium]
MMHRGFWIMLVGLVLSATSAAGNAGPPNQKDHVDFQQSRAGCGRRDNHFWDVQQEYAWALDYLYEAPLVFSGTFKPGRYAMAAAFTAGPVGGEDPVGRGMCCSGRDDRGLAQVSTVSSRPL